MQLKAVVWSCDVNGYVGLGTLWLVRHQLEFVGHWPSSESERHAENGTSMVLGCMDRQKTGSEPRHHREARRFLKRRSSAS
jgi:hypothetical protein